MHARSYPARCCRPFSEEELPKATGTLSPTSPNNEGKELHEPRMGGLKNGAITPPKWRVDYPA